MNTTTTKPNSTRKRAGSGSSWKSAIIAASLTGVLFGWAVLGRVDSAADAELAAIDNSVIVESVVVEQPTSTQASVVNSVQSNSVQSSTTSQITIPSLPQRPVFRQPVTRTRGS
ncbi:MAG: hypothetical protein KDD84_02050 [Caldilineaceae bacterium]|nr:hypothetical protein [Caldilineaceae bacterium]